jgi:cell division protein FtsA
MRPVEPDDGSPHMLRKKQPTPKSGEVTGALDIGTSKVCCLIAESDGQGGQRLLGFGHQRTRGIKAGVVVDAEKAERAVRAAVAQAERMAGLTLARVVVAVTCGRLKSESFTARATLGGRAVARADTARVLAGGQSFAERGGRAIVQMTHADWRLDGHAGIDNPLGFEGKELSLLMHAVTVDEQPLGNLLHVVDRCYLETAGVIAAPFACAMAVTTAEERQHGVVCVDLGGGTTTLAAFAGSQFMYADGVPVGGGHVSFDIARTLSTPLAEAERIKTLYGTLLSAFSDEREVISFPGTEENDGTEYQTTKARLRAIIEPRIETVYGLVAEKLDRAGLAHLGAGRVVLTGGASQMVGLAEWWSSRTGAAVRIGRPRPMEGMQDSMCSPVFAAAAGLVSCAVSPSAGVAEHQRRATPAQGYFGRLNGWIRDSF